MYTKILNPKTNRNVSIYSALGKKILKSYLNKLGGATGSIMPSRWKVGDTVTVLPDSAYERHRGEHGRIVSMEPLPYNEQVKEYGRYKYRVFMLNIQQFELGHETITLKEGEFIAAPDEVHRHFSQRDGLVSDQKVAEWVSRMDSPSLFNNGRAIKTQKTASGMW